MSEYRRSHRSNKNVNSHYNNPNAPPSQYHSHIHTNTTPSPPPPVQQHFQSVHQNSNEYTSSIHQQTTLKLSQSQTSYPHQTINNIRSEQTDHSTIYEQTNIYSIPESTKLRTNPQQRHKQSHKHTKTQKRRASQPHIMCYEPIGISPSQSPINFLDTNSSYNNYTKRELNELRMKHYNQIYQTNKGQTQTNKKPKKHRHRNENDRIYTDYNYESAQMNKNFKKRKRRHSVGNNDIFPYFENISDLSSSNCLENASSFETQSSLNTVNTVMRYDHRKNKQTSISRRKSNPNTNKYEYKNKIVIQKRRKKHKIERTKSYDTSFDDSSGFFDCDPEIIESNLRNHKSKRKKHRKKSRNRKKLEKSKSYTHKKGEKSVTFSKSKTETESDLRNKQILRIRNNDRNIGKRVVTFSRRKSLLNGQITGFESPNDRDDIIPLMSPISTQSQTRNEYLIDLQKILENERLRLESEKQRLIGKERKFEKDYALKCEEMRNKYENEYLERERVLAMKERDFEERQKCLLREELKNDILRERLLRKESEFGKQRNRFVTETVKFDSVISKFYVYQKCVNGMCNKHIGLVHKWRQIAESIGNGIKAIIYNMLKCKNLDTKERRTLDEYELEMGNICEFARIDSVQTELQNMPRPNITKRQSMNCEMRLCKKWRDYLSENFRNEYINPLLHSLNESNESTESEISNEESKELEISHKELDKIMKNELSNAFVRKKEHRRSCHSFMKTATFMENLNPFWSMQYDSGNDGLDDNDLSRNSNSSAVIQTIDDLERDEIDI